MKSLQSELVEKRLSDAHSGEVEKKNTREVRKKISSSTMYD